jgi:hypothetical protein
MCILIDADKNHQRCCFKATRFNALPASLAIHYRWISRVKFAYF